MVPSTDIFEKCIAKVHPQTVHQFGHPSNDITRQMVQYIRLMISVWISSANSTQITSVWLRWDKIKQK